MIAFSREQRSESEWSFESVAGSVIHYNTEEECDGDDFFIVDSDDNSI